MPGFGVLHSQIHPVPHAHMNSPHEIVMQNQSIGWMSSPIGGYRWVRYSGARYVVPGMVTAGRDLDGAALVVGRANHQGDILPAKAKPEHGVAYVTYAGSEIMKHEFEILMPVEFQWVPSRNGHIPPGAVEGGRTSGGEPLYVGRAIHNGVTCVGKVHPSHGSLYIPYNGQEIPFREYEVLVQQ